MTAKTLALLAGAAPSWPMTARLYRKPDPDESGGGGEGEDGLPPTSAASLIDDAHDDVTGDDEPEDDAGEDAADEDSEGDDDDDDTQDDDAADDEPGDDDDDDADPDSDPEDEPDEGEDREEPRGRKQPDAKPSPHKGKKGRQGDATGGEDEGGAEFNPEDEELLSRIQATPEEVEHYRSMTEAQREIALRPLRRTQQRLNEAYSRPREGRGEEESPRPQHERAGATGDTRGAPATRGDARASQETEPDPHREAALQRVRGLLKGAEAAPVFDQEKLKKIAKANGLAVDDLQELVTHVAGAVTQAQDKRLSAVAEILADQEAARSRDTSTARSRAVEDAAAHAQQRLSKAFPKLKNRAEFEAVVRDRRTVAAFAANVHAGSSVRAAMHSAMKLIATERYLPDLRTKHTQQAERQRRQRTRGGAERTGGTKPPKVSPRAVAGRSAAERLEEAHDQVTSGD